MLQSVLFVRTVRVERDFLAGVPARWTDSRLSGRVILASAIWADRSKAADAVEGRGFYAAVVDVLDAICGYLGHCGPAEPSVSITPKQGLVVYANLLVGASV